MYGSGGAVKGATVGDAGSFFETLNVMIVEDDDDLAEVVVRYFQTWNYKTSRFRDAESALQFLKSEEGQAEAKKLTLIICDLILPEMNGIQFMRRLRDESLQVPVIMTTVNNSVENAIRALEEGAFDYITKPLNFSELRIISERAVRLYGIEKRYTELQKVIEDVPRYGQMIGKSPKMKSLFELLERVSNSHANVLVTGESGTGKELVARAIHDKSDRLKHPFITINCSAIPADLLEAELFGYKKGAFTGAHENRRGLFEEANRGTLFLDEIGDMPLSLQAKLLRVLQERKIRPLGTSNMIDLDIRIVAATNKDLGVEINKKTFREDLYYRLCVIPISIPPLRERTEDIPLLCEHFLVKFSKYASRHAVPVKGFTPRAMQRLMTMPWRGNVRELENVIERAVILSQGEYIDDIDAQVLGVEEPAKQAVSFQELSSLDQLEQKYIRFVLGETKGHKDRAAKILGIDRKTLRRKLEEDRPI